MKIRTLLVFSLVALSLFARGASYEGTYYWSEQASEAGKNFEVLRTLKVMGKGKAELITEIRGTKPLPGQDTVKKYGEIMLQVVDQGKRTHSGSWREQTGQLKIDLNKLNGQNVGAGFDFVLLGSKLQVTNWSKTLYGDRAMTMERTSGGNRPDEPGFDARDVPGNWFNNSRISRTGLRVERRLELYGGGNCRMRYELFGDRPSTLPRDVLEAGGTLLESLDRNGRLEFNGSWRIKDGRVEIVFEDPSQRKGEITLVCFMDGKNLLIAERRDRRKWGNVALGFRRERH